MDRRELVNEKVRCPACKEPAFRALYLGVPLWLCSSEECGVGWGLGVRLLDWLPITTDDGHFAFYAYSGLSYPRALLYWLIGKEV